MGTKPFTLRVERDLATFPVDVTLPNICLKCGARDGIVRRRKRYTYTPVQTVALRAVVPVAGLGAKRPEKAVLELPLCAACDARHRRTFWLMVALWLLPIGCLALAPRAESAGYQDLASGLAMGFLATIIGVGVFHLAWARRRTAPGLVRIEQGTITLGRFEPGAIAQLEAESKRATAGST